MGQIIIEIPQDIDRLYRIPLHESAEDILLKVDKLIALSNSIEDDEILNLWADCKESASEIAEEARQSWKRNFWKNG